MFQNFTSCHVSVIAVVRAVRLAERPMSVPDRHDMPDGIARGGWHGLTEARR
jgi:hypothetical protein